MFSDAHVDDLYGIMRKRAASEISRMCSCSNNNPLQAL
ncbi:jg23534, partial [Pararge aegeria aegeria]